MKVISVNVGLPRNVITNGREVTTGIFKEPVNNRVFVHRLNVTGDGQADLEHHGGQWKAVYAYPSEHYAYWRAIYPGKELPWGMFGENLTTEGLLENEVRVGDRLRAGSAVFVVTQPRIPCYKLGIKFGREEMVKLFLESLRLGFYLSVLQEGEVGAGDTVEIVQRDQSAFTVTDLARLYLGDWKDLAALKRAAQLQALSPGWRDGFAERIVRIEGISGGY